MSIAEGPADAQADGVRSFLSPTNEGHVPTASSSRRWDVVIVGAGVVGLSTAHHLAGLGASVVLLDRCLPGVHQSGLNWGFARQQGRSSVELPLMALASKLWDGLEDELEAPVEWVRGGNLALFDDEDQRCRYLRWKASADTFGVDSRVLSPRETSGVFPALRRAHLGALWCPTDGQADPVRTCVAYVHALDRSGVEIRTGVSVYRLAVREGRVAGVDTSHGRINASTVVCAAGAWSASLLRTVGLRLPQAHLHSTVNLTNPLPPLTVATIWASDLAFRQRRDGRLVCATGGHAIADIGVPAVLSARYFVRTHLALGASTRLAISNRLGQQILDLVRRRRSGVLAPPAPRLDRRSPLRVQQRLSAALDLRAEVRIEKAWAGVIDATPDALPVIDAEALDGLVIATGFSGHGFGLSPATGLIVAQLASGTRPSVDIGPFRFDRFRRGDFHPPAAIL